MVISIQEKSGTTCPAPLKEIKEDPHLPQIPIVIVTASKAEGVIAALQ